MKKFEGIVNGTIIEERKGSNGFGYDPVFVPEGFDRTFAELSSEAVSYTHLDVYKRQAL